MSAPNSARAWRIDIQHWESYDVDEDVLLEEFGAEWDDAKERGLDVEAFVRETVDIMQSYLDESPELFRVVAEHHDVDVYARAREGADVGASEDGTL